MVRVAWNRFTIVFWAGLLIYVNNNEDPKRFWNFNLPDPLLGPNRKPRELVEKGPKRIYTYPKEEL